MKILFVHSVLEPEVCASLVMGRNPADIWHISADAPASGIRGYRFDEIRFVDVDWSDLSSDLAEAIRACQAVGRSPAPMDFGEALRVLKAGGRVARAGWNGKGMFLELQTPDAHSKMSLPYIFMFTACKNRVPWLASQTDMLGEDWVRADDAPMPAPVEPKPLPPELRIENLGLTVRQIEKRTQAALSAARGRESV